MCCNLLHSPKPRAQGVSGTSLQAGACARVTHMAYRVLFARRMHKVASKFDTHMDDMHAFLRESLTTLASLLKRHKASVSMAVEKQPPTKAPEDTEDETKGEHIGTDKTGDVTDELAKDLDTAGKKKLVAELNKAEVAKRTAAIQEQISRVSAQIIRNKLVVVPSAEAAKTWMESGSQGYLARCQIVDMSMPPECQSGRKSRRISKTPTATKMCDLGDQIKMIPSTSMLGHVLLRSCGNNSEPLHEKLNKTHSHRRSILVPISLSPGLLSKLRSASARSLGPDDDSRTGVDFTMRTIGRRTQRVRGEDAPEDGAGAASDGEDSSEGGGDTFDPDKGVQEIILM